MSDAGKEVQSIRILRHANLLDPACCLFGCPASSSACLQRNTVLDYIARDLHADLPRRLSQRSFSRTSQAVTRAQTHQQRMHNRHLMSQVRATNCPQQLQTHICFQCSHINTQLDTHTSCVFSLYGEQHIPHAVTPGCITGQLSFTCTPDCRHYRGC